jgi:hypothetical protein
MLGAIAFVASFEAIADYAGQVGWGPHMKYAAPLLVDTFTLAAGLVILARSEDGERAVYAWSLLQSRSAAATPSAIASPVAEGGRQSSRVPAVDQNAPGRALTPAHSAAVAAHAYDDNGERMGERRVGPALERAGYDISRAALRRELANLPARRNGAGVAAQ